MDKNVMLNSLFLMACFLLSFSACHVVEGQAKLKLLSFFFLFFSQNAKLPQRICKWAGGLLALIIKTLQELQMLSTGQCPVSLLNGNNLEFGKHIIIMLYFLKYSIKYSMSKIFGAKKCLNQRLHFVKD